MSRKKKKTTAKFSGEKQILPNDRAVKTAHLQSNHIKGPWANTNALAEVLEESAKEPDAGDCRISSIVVIWILRLLSKMWTMKNGDLIIQDAPSTALI